MFSCPKTLITIYFFSFYCAQSGSACCREMSLLEIQHKRQRLYGQNSIRSFRRTNQDRLVYSSALCTSIPALFAFSPAVQTSLPETCHFTRCLPQMGRACTAQVFTVLVLNRVTKGSNARLGLISGTLPIAPVCSDWDSYVGIFVPVSWRSWGESQFLHLSWRCEHMNKCITQTLRHLTPLQAAVHEYKWVLCKQTRLNTQSFWLQWS